ncbi:DUF3025 domain-containing protein [Moraxella oblonga]|uniref:DUF3025 domain-containing protein n=1 Tax=Moraxella oblonga TaxID=200413 RepID=UPI00082D3AF1|nr:DUF3025 domain-containing protein [Moraxella oblonga]
MTTFIDDFYTIDPNQLWLSPYLPIHQAFMDNGDIPLYTWLNTYFDKHHIHLTNHQNSPLSFTHQNDLEHGIAYETHIGQFHKIPTRDNLHDWFGACVWSIFPKTKSLLNAKHLAYINQNNTANKRNRVRDTITVFDENGAILVVSDDEIGTQIGQALAVFDWQHCLVKPRQYWSDYKNDKDKKAKVFIFGHALLEQLIKPYKSLCSHTVIIKVNSSFFKQSLQEQLVILDTELAKIMNELLSDDVTPRQLNPLPILGVPYFWENDNPIFYDDPFVFRNGRKK